MSAAMVVSPGAVLEDPFFSDACGDLTGGANGVLLKTPHGTSGAAFDLDGDRKSDIFWRHATLGEVWVWLMDGTTKVYETWVATVPEVGYQIMNLRQRSCAQRDSSTHRPWQTPDRVAHGR